MERERKLFHIAFGTALLLAGLLSGKVFLVAILFLALFAGLFLVQLKLSGLRLRFVDAMLRRFDRPSLLPGYGALTFVVSALLMLTFIHDFFKALGFIALLSFGDGFSSFVGRHGRVKLPWNKGKSLEGLVVFFLAGAGFSFYFLGPSALPYAAVLAVIESLDLKLDDNLVIGACGVVLFKVFA